MQRDLDLYALASAQHGAVARFQLAGLGVGPNEVSRLARSTEWNSITRQVLVHASAPRSRLCHAMIAVLDASPGAVLSHASAAALWGLPGFLLVHPEVTRPRGVSGRRSARARLHEVVALRPQQVTVLDGIPVTRPARVIFDLAATEHPGRVERALDAAWSRRLVDGRTLRRALTELAQRGRPGIQLMRELLDSRGDGYVPPASNLERRFEQVLERHGERPFRRQVDLGGDEWTGRVDFVDPELPLVVEINSSRYHAALVDRRADEARYAALRAAGFTVVVVWDHEVWHDPAAVVARIRDARRQLRAAA